MDATITFTRATVQSNTDAAGTTVIKKSVESESMPALRLISERTGSLPDHLGQYIDTTA
jgi:hypothetical protein